jgi:hypothetical protein
VFKLLYKDYDNFLTKSESLRVDNLNNFSLEKMKDKFKDILTPYMSIPKETKLVLPKLKKIS